MAREIAPATLAHLLDTDSALALIDVREHGEYNQAHIPGSTSVPRRQLESRMGRLVPFRGVQVVLCDDNGRRAALAAQTLERMGYTRVAVLEGGVPAWARSGRPLESGEPAVTPFGFDAARRVVEHVPPGPVGDAVVLSVDPSDAYVRGHVPGARWIGRGRLELLIGAAVPDDGFEDATLLDRSGELLQRLLIKRLTRLVHRRTNLLQRQMLE